MGLADEAVCIERTAAGVETAMENITFGSQHERAVITWIAKDKSSKLCNKFMLEALDLFECIRIVWPRQYEMAITDRLLLRALAESILRDELSSICSKGQQESQLFFAKSRQMAAVTQIGSHLRFRI